MTGGIQTFANNRQTYKAKHYINSLKRELVFVLFVNVPTLNKTFDFI
jgi:hypothetical protein